MAGKQDRNKESPLVAIAINEGNITTLITPHAEYVFVQGGLAKVEEIEDYAEKIREKLSELSQQAGIGAGVYSDRDIRIQIRYGALPIKTS